MGDTRRRVKKGLGKSPGRMLKLSLMKYAGFDSYLAGPLPVQRVMDFLLTPAARLLGYRSFYPAYDIRKKR